MVLMCAEFVYPFVRHGRNLQTVEPAACEMQSVIRFLNARNMKPADIHHQLCEVYGEHAVSDSMVRSHRGQDMGVAHNP
jgi:hypothetical protein